MEERNTETKGRMRPAVIISSDADALAEQAAAEFLRLANDAISRRGVFLALLSGGSTPAGTYRLLATSDLDFGRAQFFIGDERDVPPESSASNYRFIREHLLSTERSRAGKLYRWLTEKSDRNKIAAKYESEIMAAASSADAAVDFNGLRVPRFDLILLGIGTDGHTASLFPKTEALHEARRLAVPNFVPQLKQWRFTVTFPLINNARDVLFLASGREKAGPVSRVIAGNADFTEIPASGVRPVRGNVIWFIDEGAASKIDEGVPTR